VRMSLMTKHFQNQGQPGLRQMRQNACLRRWTVPTPNGLNSSPTRRFQNLHNPGLTSLHQPAIWNLVISRSQSEQKTLTTPRIQDAQHPIQTKKHRGDRISSKPKTLLGAENLKPTVKHQAAPKISVTWNCLYGNSLTQTLPLQAEQIHAKTETSRSEPCQAQRLMNPWMKRQL
jgi:hypothetical protein